MTRTTPPRTSSLHHAQDRDHVILDLDGIASDADAHRFYVRHGDALRDLLLDPLDVDTYEQSVDDYRAYIGTLEDALLAAQETIVDVAKRLRQAADSITDLDSGEPMFNDEIEELLSLSDALDKANDAANDVEVKTSW
jgi:response regulator of citrate/malate metabolism